jgi:hypothetical protein
MNHHANLFVDESEKLFSNNWHTSRLPYLENLFILIPWQFKVNFFLAFCFFFFSTFSYVDHETCFTLSIVCMCMVHMKMKARDYLSNKCHSKNTIYKSCHSMSTPNRMKKLWFLWKKRQSNFFFSSYKEVRSIRM